jgi:hypothetical protein
MQVRNASGSALKAMLAVTVAIGAMLAAVTAANAQTIGGGGYVFKPVQVPGASATVVNGLNDNGQTVGSFTDASGQMEGFVDTNGSFAAVNISGAVGTSVTGITDFGQFAGYSVAASGNVSGFVNSMGTLATLNVAGSNMTFVTGISNGFAASDYPGAVSGYSIGSGSYGPGAVSGFMQYDGPPTSFNDPSGVKGTWLTSIVDGGGFAGYYADASGKMNGFFTSGPGGDWTTVDVPGAIGTYVTAINGMAESGSGVFPAYLVGYYENSSGNYSGFIDAYGSFTTIDAPGAANTYLTGMNMAGEISGYTTGPSGDSAVGFVASQDAEFVPLPVSGGTLPGGLLLLGWFGRGLARRKGQSGQTQSTKA